MDKLIISGIPQLDGAFEFDLVRLLSLGDSQSLTNRELHRVKTLTGIRGGEIGEAFAAGDTDVTIALAVVVLTRHGRRFDEDVLWDAPAGSAIKIELGEL